MEEITAYSPTSGRCKPTSKQLELLNSVKNIVLRILCCSGNGTGKTLCLAVISIWFSLVYSEIVNRPIKVLLVSGSWRQANKLHTFIREFLEHPYLKSQIYGEPTKTEIHWNNRGWIKTFTSSEKQVLGEHPDIYLLDEAVLMEDWIFQDMYARVGGQNPGLILMTSTPEVEHYFSKFIEFWNNEKEYNEWQRIYWTWFDCPWKTRNEIDEARKRMSKDRFAAKVMGKPTFNPLGTLYDSEKLNKEVKVKIKPVFDPHSPSSMGVDFGSKNPTVFTVWQQENDIWYLIYGEDHTEKSRDFVMKRAAHLVEKYNVSLINADAAIPWLIKDLKDLRVCRIKGVNFRGAKPRMQFNLQSLIEQGRIKIHESYRTLGQQLMVYTIDTHDKDDWVDSAMLGVYESSQPRSTWYFRISGKKKEKEEE